MIVTRIEEGFQLVTQPDHARLASEILALWRADGLPRHPRREELLLAVREHDNGWREADAAPRVDVETGAPLDFRRLPRDERFAVWQRALDRLDAIPYAAALVAEHALAIHRDRPAETWGEFRRVVAARRDEARRRAGLAAAELAADYRYLELCDTLSLSACGALDGARCGGHRIRRLAATVELEPFPLAGTTTFQVPTRTVGPGPYRNAIELVAALATARWARRPIRLVPAGLAGT